MDLVIRPQSREPLYRQIYRQIVSQICNGTFSASENLPSVRSAARYLGVAVITVKTAYDKLEEDGYIYALPAKGYFVSEEAKTLASDADSAVETACGKFLDVCLTNGWSPEEIHTLIDRELRRK